MRRVKPIGERLNLFEKHLTTVQDFNKLFFESKLNGYDSNAEVEIGDLVRSDTRLLTITTNGNAETITHKFTRSFYYEELNNFDNDSELDYIEYILLFDDDRETMYFE